MTSFGEELPKIESGTAVSWSPNLQHLLEDMALGDIQAETVAEALTRIVGLMAVYTSKQLGIGLEK